MSCPTPSLYGLRQKIDKARDCTFSVIRRCDKNTRQGIPWPNPNARLVVLESGTEGVFGKPVGHGPLSLKVYLDSRAQSPSSADIRRVIIHEGLHPDFIAVLGAHFKIHPSFFVEHERVIVNSPQASQGDDIPAIPARLRQHYTMKYFELIRLPESVQGVFKMCCAMTGRHIGVTRIKGKFSEVGVVRRKCSIWRQASSTASGWDCLILTDPPLLAAKVSRKSSNCIARWDWSPDEVAPVSPGLFQNGYTDIMPHAVQMETRTGPPRTSMLDDLCFYLQQHSARLSSGLAPGPDSVAVFAKKVVAAHYLQLFTFVRSVVSTVQFHMSRQDRIELDYFDTAFVEAQWSDAQALERRTSEYCADLEAVMLHCGIPLEERPDAGSCAVGPATLASSPGQPAWDDCTPEFQVLWRRLLDVRRRAELFNAAITGLASMSGNRQALHEQELSLREAKSTKALTFIGLVFIPLAYTASLFSMAEPYGPGNERFWVYFAISLPLIFCVLLMYAVLDIAYGSGGFSCKYLLAVFQLLGETRDVERRH
ncbi:hypothetical protein RB595_007811 [Gaeumannomyces hyphopodioides]